MKLVTTFALCAALTIGTVLPGSYKDIPIATHVDQQRVEQAVTQIANELYRIKLVAYTLRGTLWTALVAGGVYMLFLKNKTVTPEELEGMDRETLNKVFIDHIQFCKLAQVPFFSMAWVKNNVKSLVEWSIYSLALKTVMDRTQQLAFYLATEHDINWFVGNKTTIDSVISELQYGAQLIERARVEQDPQLKEFALSSVAVTVRSLIPQIELVVAYMQHALNQLPDAGIDAFQLDTLPLFLTKSAEQCAQTIHHAIMFDASSEVTLASCVARFEADFNRTKIRFARDSQRAMEYDQR